MKREVADLIRIPMPEFIGIVNLHRDWEMERETWEGYTMYQYTNASGELVAARTTTNRGNFCYVNRAYR